MSVYTMRYAMEKGADIVCAFGRSPHNLGRDVGDIAGVGTTGVLVQDSRDAVAVLKELKPDACIIATASLMQDLKGPLMDCAEAGVNAITTGEEAFFPWNSSPGTTELLAQLAKKNGCTLCGSGYRGRSVPCRLCQRHCRRRHSVRRGTRNFAPKHFR